MKNFIVENWFRLVLSICLLTCSFGFLVQCTKPGQAQTGARTCVGGFVNTNNNKFYVVWSDGTLTDTVPQ